jgi:hypothetical protein
MKLEGDSTLFSWFLLETIEAMRNKIHIMHGYHSPNGIAMDKEFCEMLDEKLKPYKEDQLIEAMTVTKQVIEEFNSRLFLLALGKNPSSYN